MIECMLEKGNIWLAPMEEIAGHLKKCIDDGSYRIDLGQQMIAGNMIFQTEFIEKDGLADQQPHPSSPRSRR